VARAQVERRKGVLRAYAGQPDEVVEQREAAAVGGKRNGDTSSLEPFKDNLYATNELSITNH
jgi:hypothetical protein